MIVVRVHRVILPIVFGTGDSELNIQRARWSVLKSEVWRLLIKAGSEILRRSVALGQESISASRAEGLLCVSAR